MLRNYLAAALRNLDRNGFYGAISIAGLALGLTAAILTYLYVGSELAYDRFVEDSAHAFVVTSELRSPGQAQVVSDYAPAWIARQIPSAISQASATARLAYDQVSLRRGSVAAPEELAWVDPTFFSIVRLPAIAGDPSVALADPAGVVITRSLARKYFGVDAPIGETIELDGRQILRVGAVLADLPSETHLTQQIFASGRASFSRLTRIDSAPSADAGYATWLVTSQPEQPVKARFETVRLRTYIRLRNPDQAPAAAMALNRLIADGAIGRGLPPGSSVRLNLVPLTSLHLENFRGANLGAGDVRASRGGLIGLVATASLVLGLAVVNLVNLTTAQAAERAVEVGVRKVAGARRRDLFIQFVGEASLQVITATALAIALVELSLPALNAFLGKSMSFPYWSNPTAGLALAACVVVLSLAAGGYPGVVLSAFRPAQALKGGAVVPAGPSGVRFALVVGQFTVLIGLVVAVSVVWMQTGYATGQGLRMDTEQVLVVQATPCRSAFEAEVRRLPGVRAAACSSRNLLGLDDFDPVKNVMDANVAGGPTAHADMGLVDQDWFSLYGITPLAGRLFSRDRGKDELPVQNYPELQRGSVVINLAAARALGFSTPAAALGRQVQVGPGYGEFEIVGVTPDTTLDLKSARVKATFFLVDFANYPADQVLSIKLDGDQIPETLRTIDQLWRNSGQAGEIRRQFLDDYVQRLYVATIRQGVLVSVLCGLALLLACMGLLGLASFTAQRRTKEIGVRRALGASRQAILQMLIWQFTKPVLLACLISWPIAALVMRSWLDGFAYRIELSPLIFLAAGLAALFVACATVLTHALRVVSRRPVEALRHE
ncbi:MAG: ABC transporter permease [Phenylobacterium sp.]|jgi:putative ABC transport system permease protein|uniref:ABC transporter permease n=1 Tax=Phenylobacterium sp. TaxID=1871053 RepID=UPI0035643C1A